MAKLFHACFISALVLFHCRGFRHIGYCIFHPSEAYGKVADLYVAFPAWLSFPHWIISLIVYCYSVILGFAAAKRKPQAVRQILIILPALWLLDSIEAFRIDASYMIQKGTYYVAASFLTGAIILGIPYAILFFFYNSKRVRNALFEIEPVTIAEEETPLASN